MFFSVIESDSIQPTQIRQKDTTEMAITPSLPAAPFWNSVDSRSTSSEIILLILLEAVRFVNEAL